VGDGRGSGEREVAMSIIETILAQKRTDRLGHRKDCTLWTPDVCSCDAYYSDRLGDVMDWWDGLDAPEQKRIMTDRGRRMA